MLYSLAAALLLKFQREHPQGRTICWGHFMGVSYHLIYKRWVIAYSLSNKQSQGRWEGGEDTLARGTPHTTKSSATERDSKVSRSEVEVEMRRR